MPKLGLDRPGMIDRVFLTGILVLMYTSTLASTTNNTTAQLNRIIEILNQQERSVHSIECIFEEICTPTENDKIELINKISLDRGDVDTSYICSEEFASNQSHTSRWYAKGRKERCEFYPPSTNLIMDKTIEPRRIQAFDGQLVREFEHHPNGRIFGAIQTEERAHWNSMNRTTPYSFLYRYYGNYYSELLKQSKNVEISTISRGDR